MHALQEADPLGLPECAENAVSRSPQPPGGSDSPTKRLTGPDQPAGISPMQMPSHPVCAPEPLLTDEPPPAAGEPDEPDESDEPVVGPAVAARPPAPSHVSSSHEVKSSPPQLATSSAQEHSSVKAAW